MKYKSQTIKTVIVMAMDVLIEGRRAKMFGY